MAGPWCLTTDAASFQPTSQSPDAAVALIAAPRYHACAIIE